MKVASVTNSTTIEVQANEFSSSGADVNFFKAGDVVQHIPRGNHDAAGGQLTIQSITSNTVKFSTAHSICTIGVTIEPATFNAASTTHQEDAYLSNNSDIINVSVDAQEYN